MKFRTHFSIRALVAILLAAFASQTVVADPIYCSAVSTTKNYMAIDDSEVDACLMSGTGNLTGNPNKDPFLTSAIGQNYSMAGKSDESNPFNITFGADGSWSFDASFWDTYTEGAIGFKFGTGNNPDEWFVFSLEQGVTSGTFEFFNVFGQGGGLSHIILYGVPEPATLALFALGLLGIAWTRRRKRALA